jgi:arylsulfatase
VKCGFDRAYVLNDHNHNFSPHAHELDGKPLPPVPLSEGYYSTIAITDRAIEFLKEHEAEHADRPFFEYVAYIVPHFPLQAPAEDVARCRERYEAGWYAIRDARWQRVQGMLKLPTDLSAVEPQIGPPGNNQRAHDEFGDLEAWHEGSWSDLTAEQQRFQAAKMAVHAAMVERMDREIGRLIDQLRAMNAYEDTLVLFLSDNGASAEIMIRGGGHDPAAALGSAATFLCLGPGWSKVSNTPFRRHKSWVHEGGIATPLIAHWPRGIEAKGELRQAVAHVIDLAPTILKLAGGTWPTEFDGRPVPPHPGKDLSPTFAEDAAIDRDCLWWFHQGNRAIRSGDWKLVSAKNEPWQLYDLAHDRAENRDLSAANPDKVQQLSGRWESMMREFQHLALENDGQKPPRRQERQAGQKR